MLDIMSYIMGKNAGGGGGGDIPVYNDLADLVGLYVEVYEPNN